MGYDSSNTLNINKKIEVIKKIKNIKNIIISYKLYDANNIYTRSDLFSDVNIIKDYKHLYTNSDMMNKIFLAGMLDDLVKYDIMNDDIVFEPKSCSKILSNGIITNLLSGIKNISSSFCGFQSST